MNGHLNPFGVSEKTQYVKGTSFSEFLWIVFKLVNNLNFIFISVLFMQAGQRKQTYFAEKKVREKKRHLIILVGRKLNNNRNDNNNNIYLVILINWFLMLLLTAENTICMKKQTVLYFPMNRKNIGKRIIILKNNFFSPRQAPKCLSRSFSEWDQRINLLLSKLFWFKITLLKNRSNKNIQGREVKYKNKIRE